MNERVQTLLNLVANGTAALSGAYNLRVDGSCAGRQSSENIRITDRPDGGMVIRIAPGTKGETVSIPACVTKGGVNDLVYNDFYVGEGADVNIVAGCGIHTETGEPARHSGVHRFFLAPGSHAVYTEKHVGTGKGIGIRSIDPVTEIYLEENAVLELESAQIGGVDCTLRRTKAEVKSGAKLRIRERILTEGEQQAETLFEVYLNGENSGVDLVSRSVARGNSRQAYTSTIYGNARCTGHSACDAIIDGNASVDATPQLFAHHSDAALIHEAAIGKIAGEQILKLQTLGLSEQEAEAKIIDGFLG